MTLYEFAPWFAIAITLILSIWIPHLTQKENNKFQLKMKKIMFEEEVQKNKLKAYEEYFQNIGSFIIYDTPEFAVKAGKSTQLLFAYLSESEWDNLDKLIIAIRNQDACEASRNMESISKWIANDMKKDLN